MLVESGGTKGVPWWQQGKAVAPSGRSRAGREVAAAMVASTACPLLLNWTDVVKTRMQSQPAPGCTAPPYSGGFLGSARRIVAEEGLSSLWFTAMPASLLREVLVIGTRMGAYPAVRNGLSLLSSRDTARQGGEAGVGSKLGAGIVLGAVSGVLASPLDLVRIRLQAEAGRAEAISDIMAGRAGAPTSSTRQVRV